MAEGTYEYECMRAELLGVSKPDYEEFLQRKQEEAVVNPGGDSVENEETANDAEEVSALEGGNPEQKASGSKLEELSNMISPVVSITQKKIDSFKIRCGSVSDMIKTKIVGISGTANTNTDSARTEEVPNNGDTKKEDESNIL